MAFNGKTNKRFMSQINVTPLVDVMLVLLIIFMITAPMMQAGIDVKLPEVGASAIDTTEEPLVITIDSDRKVYLGDTPVSSKNLRGKLAAISKVRSDRMVLLRADEKVPYGFVVTVISDVRKAGIEKIGMVTEPVKKKR